jgi:hypothetical protein
MLFWAVCAKIKQEVAAMTKADEEGGVSAFATHTVQDLDQSGPEEIMAGLLKDLVEYSYTFYAIEEAVLTHTPSKKRKKELQTRENAMIMACGTLLNEHSQRFNQLQQLLVILVSEEGLRKAGIEAFSEFKVVSSYSKLRDIQKMLNTLSEWRMLREGELQDKLDGRIEAQKELFRHPPSEEVSQSF